jgi:hypothetical protein
MSQLLSIVILIMTAYEQLHVTGIADLGGGRLLCILADIDVFINEARPESTQQALDLDDQRTEP